MLRLTIPEYELFNNETNEFITVNSHEIHLEHSLISISKWESKWNKPFLVDKPAKTAKEIVDYIKCMTINKNVPDSSYLYITAKQYEEINNYISAPMTATVIRDSSPNKSKAEIMTSELIYYYMISYNIPFECEKWHINRLMTLIQVCSIKNNPNKKKMSTKEVYRSNAALNAARKKKLNTNG